MRINCTLLDSFRLWRDQDWMSESDLIASILGTFVRTDAMRLGTAFHSVLETPERYRVPFGYACDGFLFPDATAKPLLDLIDRRGVFEVKGVKTFAGHTVVAKADQIVGASIFEHKTTTSSFDIDKYLTAFQWRLEAAIFEPVSITYRVACLEEPKAGIVGLKSIETVTVYPYPALQQECAALVESFVDYVTRRGLTHALERPAAALEAA